MHLNHRSLTVYSLSSVVVQALNCVCSGRGKKLERDLELRLRVKALVLVRITIPLQYFRLFRDAVIFNSSSTDKRKFLAFINENFNASAFGGVRNVGE